MADRRPFVGLSHEISLDDIDPKVEFIFLLAGHDPAKKKLGIELDALDSNPEVLISTCNFAGFALYKENIHQLPVFQAKYKEQI